MASRKIRESEASSNHPGVLDTLKWFVVALIFAVGIVANFIYSGESLLYRMLAGLVVAALAAAVALQTRHGRQFWTLMIDARIELRRVIWPSHQETVQTTLLVIGFVILTALVLWALDWGLGKLAKLVIG